MGNFDNFDRGRSSYFNYNDDAYDKEKSLFDLIITEGYNKNGVCMEYYVTSYDEKYNRIWGEDNDRRLERAFDVMVMYTLPREDKMFSKFGLEGTDNFSMWASKRHFRAASDHPITKEEYIPKMGDIIKSKYANYFYEIVEVVEDVGMYLQSKQHVWEFVVKVFKDEGIATTDETASNEISAYTNKDNDVFDIKDVVDVKKDEFLYKPSDSEKANEDPFGNW